MVPEMALPRTCVPSACRVSAVTARHGSEATPAGVGTEQRRCCAQVSATPRVNQKELRCSGPVTRKKATISENTAGIIGDAGWRARSRVGRGGQSRFSAS